jgi:1-phosphatidylinositol phosphodiesterase
MNSKKGTLPAILATIAVMGMFSVSVISWNDNVTEKSQLTDWMKNLSDDKKLMDISIPGSHDSGARYGLLDAVGKCQDLTLDSQLNIGVRYLDIRLQANNDGSLKIIHGPVDERVSFKEVLSTCNTFLTNHPGETILLSIKNEGVDKERLKVEPAYFDDYLKASLSDEDRMLLNRDLPSTLGECRGKMVLLSRYANNSIGVDCYKGWGDNVITDLPNGIHIQDLYKVETVDEKKKAISDALAYQSSSLNFNFLSGYLTSAFPPSYSYSVSLSINPWILDQIKDKSNLGVLIADCVTEEFTTKVIGGNKS